MGKKITAEQVAEQLHTIADSDTAATRDLRTGTDGRRYVADGKPACLAAVVMHRLGTPVGALHQLDRENGGRGIRINASRAEPARRYTRGALELLDFAQTTQDTGATWGCAAYRALRATGRAE